MKNEKIKDIMWKRFKKLHNKKYKTDQELDEYYFLKNYKFPYMKYKGEKLEWDSKEYAQNVEFILDLLENIKGFALNANREFTKNIMENTVIEHSPN